MPPHLKEPIKTPEQAKRPSQRVPSTTLIPNQSFPRTREPRGQEQRELHQNLLIHRQPIPDVQTSPSRSPSTQRQDAGSEATRRGDRAPLRSAAMRKKHRRGSRPAGLPPLAGEMSEGQRGHKTISTTYNPSPWMGEGQGEGDRATFANQRR